jgi:hypothetical protein
MAKAPAGEPGYFRLDRILFPSSENLPVDLRKHAFIRQMSRDGRMIPPPAGDKGQRRVYGPLRATARGTRANGNFCDPN